jgi:hypothetical protein
MKKLYPYNELSEKKCSCGKRLKKRLVETKLPHNIRRCYRCFKYVLRSWRNRPMEQADMRLRDFA